MKNKIGKFIPNNVSLEKHETDTVFFLLNHGYNIELIPPSYIKGQHTPDILMDNVEWEIKSPQGDSIGTIERNFKRATKQCPNIIMDLHRIKIPQEDCLKFIKKQLTARRTIKKIKVITKDNKILDFSKNSRYNKKIDGGRSQ